MFLEIFYIILYFINIYLSILFHMVSSIIIIVNKSCVLNMGPWLGRLGNYSLR